MASTFLEALHPETVLVLPRDAELTLLERPATPAEKAAAARALNRYAERQKARRK